MKVDKITKRWIKNAADEHAAEHLGMRFDESRVDHLYQCLMDHVVLWEGERAGQFWSPLGWHHETLAPVFGWVRQSEHFGREVRRFRVASIFIGKKNGKSPTGAVIGLYLMRFDGERGMQVYSAARDGRQAMVVHNNAICMVRSSPSLSQELKINKATGRIVWEEGHSVYAPMSADNIKSQEGLNGSAIIDEVHTVDNRLGRVLADMGASRAEPLIFEISTAGEGIDNYGRKRWEYGEQVNAGRIKDSRFFFKAYTPDATVSDDDLSQVDDNGNPDAVTLRHWKAANPALGEILDVRELANSCIQAKANDADWAGFKARRLNLWQRAATPWLTGDAWSKASDSTPIESCYDCGGGIGLDLARVNDMTAAAVVCPSPEHEGRFNLFVRYWIPEERLESLSEKNVQHLAKWVDEGWVIATSGSVTDFTAVQDGILDMIKIVGSQVLCFDKLFAFETCRAIADETGILPVDFPQTYNSYSAPSNDFKRMTMSQELVHERNPVLEWQAGHCIVKDLGNGRIKPIKEAGASHKTIDGIQASIMALRACQLAIEQGSGEDYADII